VSLPKYHVYLEYEKEKPNVRFNLSEEELVRTFVTPYTEGKPFWFCGKLLNRSKVERVIIFWSIEDCGKLVLPNREEVANHPDKKFVMSYICAGRVKGVQVCTDKFLQSTERKT
jgi:hypothetical protein